MPVTEEVKYLKSIDGTLKDILKELKRNKVVENENVYRERYERYKRAVDVSENFLGIYLVGDDAKERPLTEQDFAKYEMSDAEVKTLGEENMNERNGSLVTVIAEKELPTLLRIQKRKAINAI